MILISLECAPVRLAQLHPWKAWSLCSNVGDMKSAKIETFSPLFLWYQFNDFAFACGKFAVIFPKLNNFLFFYLFQTNHLTSLRPSLLMVSPLWFLSAHLRWSLGFWALLPNNDHRQQICAFEVGNRMCALPDLAALLSISTLSVWQAHGQVCSGPLMYEGSFDDLI